MQLLIYIMFGGVTTLMGPILGVTVLMIVSELLRKMGHYELIFYGLIFILVLRFFPEGMINFVSGLLTRDKKGD
jgi:branched-chain amino acid transport system permease protein